MPHRSTQDGRVMMESSDKMWPTGEGAFMLQEPHEQYEKTKRYDTKRWSPQVSRCPIRYWRRVEKQWTPERVKRWSQSEKKCPIVDVTCDGSKVLCCKEQYCIGIWNIRSLNEGEWQVVKQGMARVNIDILGISELKWTIMGKYNSDGHYIYYCWQEFLRRNGVALIVNKRVQNAVLGFSLSEMRGWKWQDDLCSFPRQIIQYHSNPSLCRNH